MKRYLTLFAVMIVTAITPAAAESPVNWTGIHGGVHIGYDMADVDLGGPIGMSDTQLSYGVGIGATYRIPNTRFVVGADLDHTWANALIIDRHWSVTGRAGVVFGHVMPYALAGYKRAEAGGTSVDGWVAGGGIEFALSNSLFLAGEYRFTAYDVGGPVGLDQHEVRAALKYRFNPF